MSNLRVLAPGSMTHLMPRLLDLYLQTNSASIDTNYGPSGSLRAKIESGAEFDLYLSASTTHTRDLMQLGWLKQTDILGFNSMVLLYQSELKVTPSTVIQTLIDPRISVGMSTTGLDPSRDYAIEVLQKVSDISGVAFPLSRSPCCPCNSKQIRDPLYIPLAVLLRFQPKSSGCMQPAYLRPSSPTCSHHIP